MGEQRVGVDAKAHLIDDELRPPSWLAVAEAAARQWGVVSLEQLRACGVGRGGVEKAMRVGAHA